MTRVVFYEKPGCINNTRQKQLLLAAGHELEVRNLLEEPWTADSLRPYFGNLPVSQWFNRTAPAVKSGVVDPDSVPEQEALRLMVAMPLLIRRPLMFASGEYRVGFDVEAVNAWIGLGQADAKLDVETCPRQ
jgi:nitrogenase-associated protein